MKKRFELIILREIRRIKEASNASYANRKRIKTSLKSSL